MVYVDGFVHSLGARKFHVTESAAADRTVTPAADLQKAGFEWHHICDASATAYDLARAAVAQLADQDGLRRADAIVYATCIPVNANTGSTEEFARTRDVKHLMDFPASRLQSDFGLDHAVVFGLDQQACTAMLGSMRLARALLSDEPEWERVLCVNADRLPDGARYEQAYNLMSDGGAACIVSREPAAFKLLAAHQITNGALSYASDDETVGSYFSFTHRIVREVTGRAGITPADIDWVVPQNTVDKAWQILARLLRIPPERVWAPSRPDTGHIIAADNIVNLGALVQSGQLRAGQRILLVMAGYGLNWQAVVLEAMP
jgi:3-oxoacyl-[acyl-carrier-protein] synthase-3